MSFVKHAVIAAAGLGSRLGMGKPKCLVDIEGQPIISYLLKVLEQIEDIRIVTGFCENQVIKTVNEIRSDVIFVRNTHFHATRTLDSYAIGAESIRKGSVLYMDADIVFDPRSFQIFLKNCFSDQIILGFTDAKTEDAVYVHFNHDKEIQSFSRVEKTSFEWANLLYAPADYFKNREEGDVYQQLEKDIPLKACYINSFEVDCLGDLEKAKQFLKGLTSTF